MTNKINRFGNIDFIRFFAIFFVVWGHSLQYAIENAKALDTFHSIACQWIYSFHMPLFMIISGFFAYKNLQKGFITLIKQKATKLFLPSIVWTLVSIAIIYLRGKNPFISTAPWEWIFYNYWYITSLILCTITFYIFIKIFKNDILACILSIIFTMIVPYGSFCFFNSIFPFFWVGHFIMKYKNDLKFSWTTIVLCLIAYIILYPYWSIEYYSIYNVSSTIVKYTPLHIYKYNFWVSFFRFTLATTFSLFIIGLLNKLYLAIKDYKISNLLTSVGRETLSIYFMNIIAIISLTHIYKIPKDTNVYLYNFVYIHIYTLFVISVSMIITRIGTKIPIIRSVFFGK